MNINPTCRSIGSIADSLTRSLSQNTNNPLRNASNTYQDNRILFGFLECILNNQGIQNFALEKNKDIIDLSIAHGAVSRTKSKIKHAMCSKGSNYPSDGLKNKLEAALRELVCNKVLKLDSNDKTKLASGLSDSAVYLGGSIFEMREGLIRNIVDTNPDKSFTVWIPKDSFGYFGTSLTNMSKVRRNLKIKYIDTDDNGKITPETVQKINRQINKHEVPIIDFHNAGNPFGQYYSQEEIDANARELPKNAIIIEDLTTAPLRKKNIELGFFANSIKEDEGDERVYYALMSTGKTCDPGNRYGICLTNAHYGSLHNADLPHAAFNLDVDKGMQHIKFVEEFEQIVKEDVAFIEKAYDHLCSRVDRFNRIFGSLIKLKSSKYASSIATQLDMTGLYNFLKENGEIQKVRDNLDNQKKLDKQFNSLQAFDQQDPSKYNTDADTDLYLFLLTEIGTKMIPGLLNNVSDNKLYMRMPLGGDNIIQKIDKLFDRLEAYPSLLSLKEQRIKDGIYKPTPVDVCRGFWNKVTNQYETSSSTQ